MRPRPEWGASGRTALGAVATALMLAVGACGGEEQKAAGGGGGDAKPAGKIAVLLPDSASSSRWEKDDRRFFDQIFERDGLTKDDYIISNAEGDAAAQQSQAEQAITNGAKVLLLVNLDNGSGATIIENAHAQGVKVIDYDRLTLEGDADYYVSGDAEAAGRLQGEGLVDCIGEGAQKPRIAVLHGAPTDSFADFLKNGYGAVIDPKFESGEWEKVGDQAVPDWDNQQALTIFEQMLEKSNGRIDGVLAANDGLANATISAMQSRKLDPVPTTGLDATAEALQNILAGDQCMTVYFNIQEQADAAAQVALQLVRGEKVSGVDTKVDNEKKEVPTVLIDPVTVTKTNIEDTVIKDGFRTWEEVCVGRFAKLCPPESER